MRLHRFLVPFAAALLLAGLAVPFAMVLRPGGKSAASTQTGPTLADNADLIELKNKAEGLAIEGKLVEAHAVYRELMSKAVVRPLDAVSFDLIERAKYDQERVYYAILDRNAPIREYDPSTRPGPGAAFGQQPQSQPPATAPTTSLAEAYPPYRNIPASAPHAKVPSTTATSPNPTAVAAAPAEEYKVANPLDVAAAPLEQLPNPKRFNVVPTYPDPDGFSDYVIGHSIARGAEYLLSQLVEGEVTQGKDISETYRQGLNTLCVHALLAAGQATRDTRLAPTGDLMKGLIDKVKLYPLTVDRDKPQQPTVYARSLRAALLGAAGRAEDREVLKDDVAYLVNAHVNGAYSYDDRFAVQVKPADPNDRPRGKLNERRANDGQLRGAADQDVRPWIPSEWTAREIFALDLPPMILADGVHINGREVGPRPFPRSMKLSQPPPGSVRYPPPPSVTAPPKQLPDKYTGPFVWDNSNSQYGVMGVRAGADVGIEVPEAYWAAVQNHWLGCQLTSGQWGYRKDRPGGYLAMTAGGMASLLIAQDALEAPTIARLGRQPSPSDKAMSAAFAWLEKADNSVDVGGPRTVYLGYTLHVLGRVGLLTGNKYFGSHDWYRELSRKVVLSQWENGAWGRTDQGTADTLIDTAYSLLFLAKGRHPVMMNKLRFDIAGMNDRGEWNNRPRDLSNLSKFTSRELERPVNWQTVSLAHDAADWSDSPILYFASHAAINFTDMDLAKIRAFVDGGGLLFTQADNGSPAFNTFVDVLAKKLFPTGPGLKDLSADDEIYTLQYVIPKNKRPRLRAMANGSRLLWVHSPTDLAVSWQQRAETTKREAFEMGVNLFVYAAGKSDLRNRLDPRAVPALPSQPSTSVPLARLKYGGNWDPEPAAWARFARYLQWETSLGLEPTPIDLTLDTLKPQAFKVAHLAGTTAYTPTEAELAALRAFVSDGGTLIVEPVGPSDAPFAESLQSAILPGAFPGAKFDPLADTDPMLHATFKGMEDVWPPRVRPYAQQKLGKTVPPVRAASVGKGRVIYLPLDATTGLAGASHWPIMGYEPGEAMALVKNVLLWTLENQP